MLRSLVGSEMCIRDSSYVNYDQLCIDGNRWQVEAALAAVPVDSQGMPSPSQHWSDLDSAGISNVAASNHACCLPDPSPLVCRLTLTTCQHRVSYLAVRVRSFATSSAVLSPPPLTPVSEHRQHSLLEPVRLGARA
eukprot:TRINITY_DN21354_c0_g1_i1.p2 TRINITY_DN21354_c0_g1~~TRINITY_DN21354_c0_g1_i1.p2  ORF type:complete len:154 (+),score=28.17 TRINITY_DN21354_c0_g1_i1:56-463(+)